MEARVALTLLKADEQKKEDAFKDVKRQLPVKLKLETPAKFYDAIADFQNLLRESLTALESKNIEIAQNKFSDVVLLLREHRGELGTFSGHAESFEIVGANFKEFSDWLYGEKKREEVSAFALEAKADLAKEKRARPIWKKVLNRV